MDAGVKPASIASSWPRCDSAHGFESIDFCRARPQAVDSLLAQSETSSGKFHPQTQQRRRLPGRLGHPEGESRGALHRLGDSAFVDPAANSSSVSWQGLQAGSPGEIRVDIFDAESRTRRTLHFEV